MDLPKAKLFAAGAGLAGLLYLLKKRKKQTFDANNKTILITGASSGIGLSMAILYARQGARLVLNARSEDALAAAERAVLDAGAAAVLSVRGDVATAEGRARRARRRRPSGGRRRRRRRRCATCRRRRGAPPPSRRARA